MKTALTLFALLFWTGSVLAQQPTQSPQPPQPPQDPLGQYLFPPEMIMQHQKALGLTEDQKSFFKSEIQKSQSRFTDLQWQLQNEMETMADLLKQAKTDEAQTLSQLDKILAAEREIKRTHFGLVLRLKNKLTAEQVTMLQEMKGKR